jgi:hypothetical protein
MNTPVDSPVPAPKPKQLYRRLAMVLGVFIVTYFCLAYILAPILWERYADRHPAWENVPRITHTSDKHPGDPLNVAIIGTEYELKKTLITAGWYPADPLSLKSSLEIAEASVLDRKYAEAPVSSLFLFDRKQDLGPLSNRWATIRANVITFAFGNIPSRHPMDAMFGLGQPLTTNALD